MSSSPVSALRHLPCEDSNRALCLERSASGSCASERVRRQCRRTCGECHLGHPRIFVYDNPGWHTLQPRLQSLLSHPVRGSKAAWARIPSRPLSVQPFLYERLVEQNSSADSADFFFYFQEPHGPPFSNWTAPDHRAMRKMRKMRTEHGAGMGDAAQNSLAQSWADLSSGAAALHSRLVHATPSTKHRHIVVPFISWSEYRTLPQYRSAVPDAQLRPMLLDLAVDGLTHGPRASSDPFQLSMPSVSHVMWSRALEAKKAPKPWKPIARGRRVTLIALDGTSRRLQPRTAGIGRKIRARLALQCRRANNASVCATPFNASPTSVERFLRIRQRSVFCLEPPGYTRTPRSVLDSLLLGCIPVLFLGRREASAYLPQHLAPWIREAAVLIEPRRFLSHGFDLVAHLRAIPPAQVRSMQYLIGRYAHRLTYSRGRIPHSLDAVDILLQELVRRFHQRWQYGPMQWAAQQALSDAAAWWRSSILSRLG